MFIHGLLGWPEVMEPLAAPLAAAGVSTTLVELQGTRRHWQGLDDEVWRKWVEQVVSAVGDARGQAARVLAIGAYGGGLLAAIAATKLPVDGVALLCPPLMVKAPGAFLRRRRGLIQTLTRLGQRGKDRTGGNPAGLADDGPGSNGGGAGLARADGRPGQPAPLLPDGDPFPSMLALQANLIALRHTADGVLADIRCPAMLAYPRRGGLNPEGSMDAVHGRLAGAAFTMPCWVDSPDEVYGPECARLVYRFASRCIPTLPPLPMDSDKAGFEKAVKRLKPQVDAAVQRVIHAGSTGPCQVVAFLVTEYLVKDGYDAILVGAAEGGTATEISDHYWTEVRLADGWYVVDFTAYGPLNTSPVIRAGDAARKDGYVPGPSFDLRLPSVRRKILAGIGSFNPGLARHIPELGGN